MVDLATKAMVGEKLKDMGYGVGLYRKSDYVAVKVPVFSFEKLVDVDTHLGPEMKSTGEVLGIGKTIDEALYKGLVAAGYKMEKLGRSAYNCKGHRSTGDSWDSQEIRRSGIFTICYSGHCERDP